MKLALSAGDRTSISLLAGSASVAATVFPATAPLLLPDDPEHEITAASISRKRTEYRVSFFIRHRYFFPNKLKRLVFIALMACSSLSAQGSIILSTSPQPGKPPAFLSSIKISALSFRGVSSTHFSYTHLRAHETDSYLV